MTQQSTATVAVSDEQSIPVRHDSVVECTYSVDGGWEVRVDEQVVATFDERHEANDLRHALVQRVKQAAIVIGLRELADYLEAHADAAPWSYVSVGYHADAAEYRALVARHQLGHEDKSSGGYTSAERRFTGGVRLSVQTYTSQIREAELAAREQQLAEREAALTDAGEGAPR